jgi:hypothetical protein
MAEIKSESVADFMSESVADFARNTQLTMRAVFGLALRQTEGLIGSVIDLLGLALAVPDHSTLSRRSKTLEMPPLPPVWYWPAAFARG